MTTKHMLAAIMVAIVWGLNFVAMKMAFVEIPPFLFLVLRLVVTVVPLIFFFPKPKVSMSLLLWMSLVQWILHFGFLFSGMYLGLSGGITALIMQCQIIFTLIMTFIYFGNKPSLLQMFGLAVSFSGLILLTTHGDCSANIPGILLIVCAALAVSVSNILFRAVPKDTNMSAMTVWSSAFAVPQALVVAYVMEGGEVAYVSLINISMPSVMAILYTVFVSTMIGIVTWSKLMSQADPVKILPFSLLVPVVALSAGYVILDEPVTLFDVIACAIIISGLLVNQLAALSRAKVVKLELEEEVSLKKAA
jgi:O-acetylserine/cysteine efflux transporter